MRKTLLLITGAYTVGGGVAAVNRLIIKALTEHNHTDSRLTILALHEPLDSQPDPFYVNSQPVIWKPFGGKMIAFTLEAWRRVLKEHFDFILADTVGIASALTLLSRLGLCAYTVWCHGLEVSRKHLSLRRRWALLQAQKRLAVSPTTRENLLRQFPLLEVMVCETGLDPKINLQPQGTTDTDSIYLRSVSGEQKVIGQKVILCVGRLWSNQRHKGQDALIKAMPKILAAIPDAQLILAGEGDWSNELATLAKTNRVAESVFLPGFIPDALLFRLYSSCYLFALPSKGEGFGLVYLEAMYWSKPCLGGKLDAAGDVIINGQTGLLLDNPHDPTEIASAVIRLLSEPQLAKKVGQAGRQRLEKHYLFSHFCQRFYRCVY